jgi:CoA:oxalate CoA-transferase
MILADLGARVIKIEAPGGGDFVRANGPFVNGLGTYFASINRGKESLTVNLKHPEGKALVLGLARRADVAVQNFVPGTMESLGLGYDVLCTENPRLIYASCSGFGQTGPYRDRPALDIIVQAMAGTMSITGEPGRPPNRVGYSIGDTGASLFLAVGILAALHERDRSGQGQHVDVAMLDAQVALLENAFIRYLAAGEMPEPLGSDHPVVTPFGAFKTKDGYLALAASKDGLWHAVCDVLDRPGWKADPRFVSVPTRRQHRTLIRTR